ncbi:hypothetical protein J7T55_011443 [Diaporthe amygdali]|uniref:uncharacterized protein n=1 Tax=Phomopsis amygdali TaxID=1214568 RepID=UPI0022FEA13C|nr:uncharacterized protein J7T55_011443 [Diaporthe amygdali]KAJ0122982.1 hypothetical protein J7T55_011443 [Diaporthe amygdali]
MDSLPILPDLSNAINQENQGSQSMESNHQTMPPPPPARPGSSRPRSKSMHHLKQKSKSNTRSETQNRSGRSLLSRQDSASASHTSGRDTGSHVSGSQQKPRAKSLPGRSNRIAARATFLDDIKHEVMVNYLYQQQCSRLWVSDGNGDLEGVVVRKSSDQYMACPPELSTTPFAQAMAALGVQCAMTVNSRIIKSFLAWSPGAIDVPLMNGLRIQILPCVQDLARARKQQCAAFIAAEGLLIVWDDDTMHLIERAAGIETELMQLVWKTTAPEEGVTGDNVFGTEEEKHEIDAETGEIKPQKRQKHKQNSVLVSLTLCLITASLGAALRQLVIESALDLAWLRIALISLFPMSIFFTLFFCQVIWGSGAQMIGPVRQMKANSKFFSAIKPPRLQNTILPHVTIQCPIYKEGLNAVIMPTVRSVKAAMTTYELQGGSANLFVNDDGLQLLDEQERQARIQFYSENGIGWTARPRHGDNGFQRRGKFKKASNMNYALMLSCRLEDKLVRIQRHAEWTQNDEAQAYCEALAELNKEMQGRAWMDGNIRVGDYIMLIDSDTRVPEDCLLDSVSEMELSPEVGILQFSSGVMQVVNTYFENGITFFTNLIYSAIRYTVANGDVAPFVGHNAILRWSALQTVSYEDEDGYEKFWSESHVSEDFDMSLRLQCSSYIIRLATWAGDDFKEGVSLTVYDELARWEKYAYGCNELLFHPIRKWAITGPFTPLFRKFLCSGIPTTSKITVVSYIGTYYAIAAAWIMTSTNYFLYGWFSDYLDRYYVDSWQVWFSIIIVFNGLGNIGLAAMRYRGDHKSFFGCLLENMKWMVLLAIFLGGLSLHVSQAILSHMFEIDMTWGATSKEAEFSNFWIEVPRVIKKFRYSMIFSFTAIIVMITLAVAPFIPYGWHITDFVAILPMATVAVSHMLLPIALNPALMTFSW